MSFWQTVTGSDLTREWKAFEARAEAFRRGDAIIASCGLICRAER
jgi:hypothetical protein